MSITNYFGMITASLLVSSCVGMSIDRAANTISRAIDRNTDAVKSQTLAIKAQPAPSCRPGS